MRSEVDLRLKYTHEQPWKLWRCHDAMLLCTRVAVSGLLPWKSQLCPDPTAWTQGTRKGAFIIPARLSVSLDRSRSFSKAVSSMPCQFVYFYRGRRAPLRLSIACMDSLTYNFAKHNELQLRLEPCCKSDACMRFGDQSRENLEIRRKKRRAAE